MIYRGYLPNLSGEVKDLRRIKISLLMQKIENSGVALQNIVLYYYVAILCNMHHQSLNPDSKNVLGSEATILPLSKWALLLHIQEERS